MGDSSVQGTIIGETGEGKEGARRPGEWFTQLEGGEEDDREVEWAGSGTSVSGISICNGCCMLHIGGRKAALWGCRRRSTFKGQVSRCDGHRWTPD